jgi:hypothetical protein
MDERAKKHIKTIRVRQERDLIANLTSTVTDQNLRRLLRPASHLLDKVEGFFLNPQILQEDRNPVALAKWLREADRVVQLATQQRKSFELIIKKFGSNASHGALIGCTGRKCATGRRGILPIFFARGTASDRTLSAN